MLRESNHFSGDHQAALLKFTFQHLGQIPPFLVELPVFESLMVCPGAVGLAHWTMVYSVFSCFGSAVQLTHLTTVIIRVHILLRPSANDVHIARD